MLEIVRYNEEEYTFPCLLVLGCFDGLHIGHQDLLKKAKLQAKINGLDLGVMTFADGKGGKQLYTLEERIKLLEEYNVKFVLLIDFNEEFKKIKPLDFLACLEDKLNVKAYMSGKDFRFGQGKKGKASTLKNYAEDEDNGVWYTSVKDVTCGDEKVSSSWIKSLLDDGNVAMANELLGRPYSVSGTVINGADRGGKVIGFPTMNVEYPADKYEVKRGVYTVKCKVGDAEYDGIANYGDRPTFGESEPVLEVYLKDFGGDHYGEQITVSFVSYIRDIVKFDSAEALAEQLKEDLNRLDGAETSVEETVEEVVEEVVAEEPTAETVEEPAAEEPVEELAVTEAAESESVDDEFEAELEEAAEEQEEIPEEPENKEVENSVTVEEADGGEEIPKVSSEIDENEVDAGEFDIGEFMTETVSEETCEIGETVQSDEEEQPREENTDGEE